MSEAIRTETAHPRRSVRSVAAVLAGIVVDVLLTIGTDLALRLSAVGPANDPRGRASTEKRADVNEWSASAMVVFSSYFRKGISIDDV